MSLALRHLRPLARRLGPQGTPACRQQSRGFAAEAHGDHKVNAWEAPTHISKWKEEHIVFLVLGSWFVVIYGSMKVFGKHPEDPFKNGSNAPASAIK